MPRLRNAAACSRSLAQAMEWLNPHFGAGEEWTAGPLPLATYHKVPYLLALTGRLEECTRALNWIKANLSARDGDFHAAPAEDGKPPTRAPAREKAWIALAAHLTGRFDLSYPAAEFLAGHQGRITGGVYDLDAEGRRETSADVRTAGCAGMVFLACGRLPEARLAGRFLVRAIQLQAEHDRFYVRLDAEGRPATRFPRDESASHVLARSGRRTQMDHLAIAMISLCRLHLATSETDWLEAAMDYFAFAGPYGDEAWFGEEGAALSWAAAGLYGITRRRLYYDAAERVTQAWIDRQRPDGSWRAGGAAKDEAAAIALTAQTAVCLLEALREAQ